MAEDLASKAPSSDEPSNRTVTIEEYSAALNTFDAAVCEALAVGQAIGVRFVAAHIGYATHVFARMCAHATAIIRAVPKSRWVSSDSDWWDFSAIAGHTRSIIEGQLLLSYIIKTPESPAEWSARLNVMHLNDCSRRIKILSNIISAEEVAAFSEQAEEIRNRLKGNHWFCRLDQKLQKQLLSGDSLTITPRDQQLEELGWNKTEFYMLWNLLSQYTHILPLSFYRLEPNGRGTGIENDCDRTYIYMSLDLAAKSLADCVDWLIEKFPDTAHVRKGTDSKFSPGPLYNRSDSTTQLPTLTPPSD